MNEQALGFIKALPGKILVLLAASLLVITLILLAQGLYHFWQTQVNISLFSKFYLLLLFTIAIFSMNWQNHKKANLLLFLLVAVLAITAPSLVWLGLASRNVVPASSETWWKIISPLVISLTLVACAWGFLHKCRITVDSSLFISPIILFFTGISMISRIGLEYSGEGKRELIMNMAFRQCLWLCVGLAAMCFTCKYFTRPRIARLCRKKNLFPLISAFLLILTWLLGPETNQRRLWLSIGGFSFQTVELVKLLLVLYVVGYLSLDKFEVIQANTAQRFSLNLKASGPLAVMMALPVMALFIQKDFGPVVLLFGFFILTLFLATGNLLQPILLLLMAGIVGFAGYILGSPATLLSRVNAWLDPFHYSAQISKAFWHMASGGLWGKGWGLGLPHKIPLGFSDFAFAAMAEELGFIGIAAILTFYAIFIIRSIDLAHRSNDAMYSLLAVTIALIISLQTCLVIGGVTGAIPLAGLTVPFVSAGGSSLVINFILLGFLLRISNDLKRI